MDIEISLKITAIRENDNNNQVSARSNQYDSICLQYSSEIQKLCLLESEHFQRNASLFDMFLSQFLGAGSKFHSTLSKPGFDLSPKSDYQNVFLVMIPK